MPWYGEDEEQQAPDRTVFAGSERLLSRLKKAVNRTNLGASANWPLAKRASYCLRIIGGGGAVSTDNPQTVRRAITILENYVPRSGA